MTTDPESELLVAVADAIRTALSLDDFACDIDTEDNVPAIAGTRHVIITPSSFQTGPRHRTTATGVDFVIGCRAVVFHRITDVPRDRRRNVYLDRTRGINSELSKIIKAVDFEYDILSAANTAMGIPTGGGFIEPLRLVSLDPRPQMVMRDDYAAAGTKTTGSQPQVAMKRGVNFSFARFLKNR